MKLHILTAQVRISDAPSRERRPMAIMPSDAPAISETRICGAFTTRASAAAVQASVAAMFPRRQISFKITEVGLDAAADWGVV